ncbi:hypothetical protein [Methylobacterium brachiatum]|uniref:hypothetical protein n=1 Tax=Methylobacterium brachiatum TaxID=269660 RepID=UPI0024468823|nr:hypothetical protein [Methylobacterium brachiatum]MDH2313350.1 hypothetical protein [Methylobacterium brachiatum]
MAWIEVTTEFHYQGSGKTKVNRHTINSDQVMRISEGEDGKATIWFALAKGESIQTLTVREKMDDIVMDIKNREAVLARSA